MFGQPASWHTVCRPSRWTRPCSEVYSGPILALILIDGGLRSIGVSALRASIRSIRRPSGATVPVLVERSVVTAEAYARRHREPQKYQRVRDGRHTRRIAGRNRSNPRQRLCSQASSPGQPVLKSRQSRPPHGAVVDHRSRAVIAGLRQVALLLPVGLTTGSSPRRSMLVTV